MKKSNRTQILDCTIRDGGYLNEWCFEKETVREVYRAASKGGVDFIELGFRSSTKYFDPGQYGTWRFTSEEDLKLITNGIKGARIALMGDFGKFDIEDLVPKKDSAADLIRVATHLDNIPKAIQFLGKVKQLGYLASLQCMGYTTYSADARRELVAAIRDSALDYVYVGDSYGSMFPSDVKATFEPLLEIGTVQIGFHPHNNLEMAFANTLEAIRCGVHIIDSSIYGMGRGSGNLPTEIILAYLSHQGDTKYNVIPILNVIDKYFEEIKRRFPWGYHLPYMISGIFNCHPYYASEFIKRREYAMEDIWKALEVVEEMKPIGFDSRIVENLINKGILGSGKTVSIANGSPGAPPPPPTHTVSVPYADRHKGKDFLILGNGPSLKDCQSHIQEFITAYDPVILGANNLAGLFQPHYHAFNNKKRFFSYISTVHPVSKLLIGENIPPDMIQESVHREYETLYFRDLLDADFDIHQGVIQTSCRTISVLLIGVAIVMGAGRVFIAGMDGYLNKNLITGNLFYEEKFEPSEYELNLERHHWNEKFLRQIDAYIKDHGGEGIHIITPTSHSAFYKGISNYI